MLFESGKARAGLSASTAHCGHFSVACVGYARTGVDVEQVEARRPEFYDHNFSEAEKDWVRSIRSRHDVSMDAAFTLLWTVKEAFLKAAGRSDWSVWTFPRWTVEMDSAAAAEVLRTGGRGKSLRYPACMRGHGHAQTFEAATMQVRNMILTTLQYREAPACCPDLGSDES
jgi:4'-phosphopantetheinyl transferase EntD